MAIRGQTDVDETDQDERQGGVECAEEFHVAQRTMMSVDEGKGPCIAKGGIYNNQDCNTRFEDPIDVELVRFAQVFAAFDSTNKNKNHR